MYAITLLSFSCEVRSFSAIAFARRISYSDGWLDSSIDVLLLVEGVVSSFGSSATFSLSSDHDGVETSSVMSDVVSISISGSGSEMIGSEFIELPASSEFTVGTSTTTALLRYHSNLIKHLSKIGRAHV